MSDAYILQQLINGLVLGSLYALIAVGFTMIYGIVRLINFAHGDILMVGAFSAFAMLTAFDLPLWSAILAVLTIGAILAMLMWIVGAFFAWGSSGGPHTALVLPPLVMYLQFAVFDRSPAGLGWMAASALAIGGAVVCLAMERREETGRARDSEGRPLGRRSMVMAVVMAAVLGLGSVSLANGAADVVSEYGNAPWRSGDGLGRLRPDPHELQHEVARLEQAQHGGRAGAAHQLGGDVGHGRRGS